MIEHDESTTWKKRNARARSSYRNIRVSIIFRNRPFMKKMTNEFHFKGHDARQWKKMLPCFVMTLEKLGNKVVLLEIGNVAVLFTFCKREKKR